MKQKRPVTIRQRLTLTNKSIQEPVGVTATTDDDLGLRSIEQHMAAVSRQLAQALDLAISCYVESIEERPVNSSQEIPGYIGPEELSRHGFKIELRCHDEQAPDIGWYNFFVWRRASNGSVLAWRVINDSYVNQKTDHMHAQTTLQTLVLPREVWPDGLRRFLAEGQ